MNRIARSISLLMAFLMAAVLASSAMTGVAFANDEDASSNETAEETINNYKFDGGCVENLKSGAAQYDAQSKTLTLTDVDAYMVFLDTDASITIALAGTNKAEYLSSEQSPAVTIEGPGSLNTEYTTMNRADLNVTSGNLAAAKGISVDSISMAGGGLSSNEAIVAASITIQGGTPTIEGRISTKSFVMNNGRLNRSEGISSNRFTMNNGSITLTKPEYGIRTEAFTMNGGKLTISDPGAGIYVSGSRASLGKAVVQGGDITITNPSKEGIHVYAGNLTMKGGKLSITKSYGDGINVYCETYRGKTYGGKIKITGGALTSTVRKNGYALNAPSISNKASCLKKIKGKLPDGATFKVAGNEYKVNNFSSCLLSKYGSSKKNCTFTTVKFGGTKWDVTGVCSNAFKTKAGAKVTSLTFRYPYTLEANAFNGTKSLTSLKLNTYLFSYPDKELNKKLNKKLYNQISKKAFKKAGKSNGAHLTVYVYDSSRQKALTHAKRHLTQKGLAHAARVAFMKR